MIRPRSVPVILWLNPNYHTIALISHASKVMLKISKPGFNSMWTMNFQMFKLDLEKTEEPEIKLSTSVGSQEKTREFQKNIYFCFIDCTKAFDSVDHNKLWKIFRDGNTRPSYLPPEKPVCRSRSKLELDMEQHTGSKSGKDYVKPVFCHPAYLTYMQSTSCLWMRCQAGWRASWN